MLSARWASGYTEKRILKWLQSSEKASLRCKRVETGENRRRVANAATAINADSSLAIL